MTRPSLICLVWCNLLTILPLSHSQTDLDLRCLKPDGPGDQQLTYLHSEQLVVQHGGPTLMLYDMKLRLKQTVLWTAEDVLKAGWCRKDDQGPMILSIPHETGDEYDTIQYTKECIDCSSTETANFSCEMQQTFALFEQFCMYPEGLPNCKAISKTKWQCHLHVQSVHSLGTDYVFLACATLLNQVYCQYIMRQEDGLWHPSSELLVKTSIPLYHILGAITSQPNFQYQLLIKQSPLEAHEVGFCRIYASVRDQAVYPTVLRLPELFYVDRINWEWEAHKAANGSADTSRNVTYSQLVERLPIKLSATNRVQLESQYALAIIDVLTERSIEDPDSNFTVVLSTAFNQTTHHHTVVVTAFCARDPGVLINYTQAEVNQSWHHANQSVKFRSPLANRILHLEDLASAKEETLAHDYRYALLRCGDAAVGETRLSDAFYSQPENMLYTAEITTTQPFQSFLCRYPYGELIAKLQHYPSMSERACGTNCICSNAASHFPDEFDPIWVSDTWYGRVTQVVHGELVQVINGSVTAILSLANQSDLQNENWTTVYAILNDMTLFKFALKQGDVLQQHAVPTFKLLCSGYEGHEGHVERIQYMPHQVKPLLFVGPHGIGYAHVSQCMQFQTCSDCLNAKDPHCGFNNVTRRCALLPQYSNISTDAEVTEHVFIQDLVSGDEHRICPLDHDHDDDHNHPPAPKLRDEDKALIGIGIVLSLFIGAVLTLAGMAICRNVRQPKDLTPIPCPYCSKLNLHAHSSKSAANLQSYKRPADDLFAKYHMHQTSDCDRPPVFYNPLHGRPAHPETHI